MFNWHRSYDDGIWLDEGKGDVELVCCLQMHPWIIDPFDSLENESVEEPKTVSFVLMVFCDGIVRSKSFNSQGNLSYSDQLSTYLRPASVLIPLCK